MNQNEKRRIYQQMSGHIRPLISGESGEIAVLATVAAELRLAFAHFRWVGFYRVVSPGLLKAGPYQMQAQKVDGSAPHTSYLILLLLLYREGARARARE